MSVLEGKKVILGITGSIAAYKSVYLLRSLIKAGAEVQVVTTPSVAHFVGELSFASLSGRKVFSGLWSEDWSAHVEIGTWADMMLVVPATANTLAKMAHGQCDNALLAVYLAARCPVMVAPAMDVDMYIHPATSRNLQLLEEMNVKVLPVGIGFLASGLEGPGRMMEPDDIMSEAEQLLLTKDQHALVGKRVLISAGPTREAIDPVRFITNHSTGKMGYALAKAAKSLGAEVTLISGPVQLQSPQGVDVEYINSADEMYQAVSAHAPSSDIVVMTAAVADYKPSKPADQKMKKKDGDLQIELSRTTDILASLGKLKKPGQTLVGFALETQNEVENAKGKLERKNLDFIVLNSLRNAGAGFGHDTNKITILDKSGNETSFPLKDKTSLAHDILQLVVSTNNS
ncbi:MAG: bifunctional phosphopantothenoylcysteine decarboxylase/phosphopantothenate--cysteine ligase CoaBC [Bacteroidia bacterium]